MSRPALTRERGESVGVVSGLFDNDTSPECDAIFDIGRRLLWLRVIPSGAFVDGAIDDNVIVTRLAFPRAIGVLITAAKIFAVHGIRREVMIALDDYRIVALSQNRVMPDRFHSFDRWPLCAPALSRKPLFYFRAIARTPSTSRLTSSSVV